MQHLSMQHLSWDKIWLLGSSFPKAKDEKVNDEKATMQKAPLKADLIIQLKDLQNNFNNLEAINKGFTSQS